MGVAAPVVAAGRLAGLHAVITGAAGGIGAAVAARCAAEGAAVAVLDRLEDEGRATADALGAVFVPVDLADPAAAADAVERADAALGGIDVLVNSAGVLRLGPLLETTAADWDAVHAVNARAVLVTMQVAARAMQRTGGGRIVNIASMAAKTGGAGEAAYAASKAAVVALSRAAALEWGPLGITVNALCPDYVLTGMGAATRTDADVAAWTARSALGRLGEPDDVAAAACFLASADGAYLTGQAINVSGGIVTC